MSAFGGKADIETTHADEGPRIERTWQSRPSCCEGHRHLKGVSAGWKKRSGLQSMIKRGATFYALVHVCTIRSCRADRDSRILCSVPSRRLSVAQMVRAWV